MPWVTPTLDDVRAQARDSVQSQLRSGPMIPNSGLRVMTDTNAGLAFLVLLYIDWLARQLLPDTAETEWLDRHATIWLKQGRKAATFAVGQATMTGIQGSVLPAGTELQFTVDNQTTFLLQVTQQTTLGDTATEFPFVALTAGETGLQAGSGLALVTGIPGINGSVTVSAIADGVNGETDDELRVRVLDRIRQPPMGGDADDYVQWALEVPGVTRAWCSPNEMGAGTLTLRFMMDDLRATSDPLTNGIPLDVDVQTVYNYVNTKRSATVKDFYCFAPIPQPVNLTVVNLTNDTTAVRAAIAASLNSMLIERAAPASSKGGVNVSAQTIYAVWITQAIMDASGVVSFDTAYSDANMANNGCLAVLGTITYIDTP